MDPRFHGYGRHMRNYNKQLNEDITKLKLLHAKKDKTDFNALKAELMKQHGISKATIYREMKKEQPGTYKRPKYDPPIREVTAKEKELVSGMLYKQMPVEQVRAEMEKQTGESYSWDRIDKIRSEIEREVNEIPEDKIIDLRTNKSIGFEYESPYGEDMKEFLGRFLNIDKIDPCGYVTIPYKGHGVRIGNDTVQDFHTWIANSAASKGSDVVAVSRITLKHLAAELVRKFSQGKAFGSRDLTEIQKILSEYEVPGNDNSQDFEYMVKVIQHFAPKAKRADIVFAASRFAEEFEGICNSIKPDYNEARAVDAKWARDHM